MYEKFNLGLSAFTERPLQNIKKDAVSKFDAIQKVLILSQPYVS
jgi:hypothetical protein